jgi:uncharacterized coiled-coil protein SlyX
MSNKFEDLKDLEGLIKFVFEPVNVYDSLVYDPFSYFSAYLNEYNPTKDATDPTIFGWTFSWPWPFSVIADFFTAAFQALETIWLYIRNFFYYIPLNLIYWVIRKLWDFLDATYYGLISFVRNPLGFLGSVVQSIINGIVGWINWLYSLISSIIRENADIIWRFIQDRTTYLANIVYQYINTLWTNISISFSKLAKDIVDPIANTFAWLWDQIRSFFYSYFITPLTIFFNNLKTYYSIAKDLLERIFRTLVDFFNLIITLITNPRKFIEQVRDIFAELMNEKWFISLVNTFRPTGEWLQAWWEFIIDTTFKAINAVKIPVPSESLNERAIWSILLSDAAKFLGAMTLMGVLVSRLSNLDLGHLAAILYDMSGYKLITGALMGTLVAAAFAQPLKYFYNAKYRPYLPKFGDVFTAFSRNILGSKGFLFHMKWEGIPDTYFRMYEKLGSDPLSPFLIRGIAEAEIGDPDIIFKYVMDRGYDVQKSVDITNALLWRAPQSYRKKAEDAVYRHLVEGYITTEEFEREIAKIRQTTPYRVSYSSIDGETWTGIVFVPLSQSELLKIASEWDAKFDRLKERENSIKADLRAGDIDVVTARKELSEIIKDRNKIEDIIRTIEKTKKTKEEPDRGKAIRTALKSLLRSVYKDGFITYEVYSKTRQEANNITDPNILEDMLAHWSAFYDDRIDQINTLKDEVKNELISLEEFRKRLIDLGMRPSKIDLIIKDIKDYLTIKRRNEIAKLEKQVRSLRDKLNGLAREITDLEQSIEAETNPKKVSNLQVKYAKKVEQFLKYQDDLKAAEEELTRLRSLLT